MSSNPGHYGGLLVTSPTIRTENGLPLKQLKLLRADDTLLIGHVYRLVGFEESGGLGVEMKRMSSTCWLNPNPSPLSNSNSITVEQEVIRLGNNGGGTSSSSRGGVERHSGDAGGGAWKRISEIGT
ncbi:hypothetical protein H0E87_023801 [Populus deltoides]|uniref:Uncharacterized protein n=1 Tax=Populus deltoides TaxID=3696 RepID=A0A8T2X542_POPDE|nr:hypothetical protein H0E87_023801 [Populus deltoides]